MSTLVVGAGGLGRAVAERLEGDVLLASRSGRDGTLAMPLPGPVQVPDDLSLVVWAAGEPVPQLYASEVADWSQVTREIEAFTCLVQAVLPALRANRGCLVALTTAALNRHSPADVLSTAPKGAISAIVRALAREEGRFGVRANEVAVGVIAAGMFEKIEFPDGWKDAVVKNVPLGCLGTAQDVADAVAYLATAPYVTGQRLAVDGGWSV
ncbi:MAG: SDR family oxidoreductase [Proteobacteria bacterium]|nr:SDR family oxidoreductase [Pseudomonadota bacterium]MCP4922103.1 SDR family oxidoreductase [Pseudomonadota bacterium]